MSPWSVARDAALLALLVMSAVAARRDRRFLPLLAFAVWMAAVDVVREPLVDVRYEYRIVTHLDQALYLSVYFAFFATCAQTFGSGRGRWWAAGGWMLFLVALVLKHDLLPEVTSAFFYAAASAVVLAGCWTVILRAVLVRVDVEPGLAHLAVMVLVAGDTVTVLYGFVDFAPGGVEALASNWVAIHAVNVLSLGLGAIIAGVGFARA